VRPRLAIACLLLLVAFPAPAAPPPAVRLVVRGDAGVESLTRAQVADLFLKRETCLPDGTRARPVDLVSGSPVRESFSRLILERQVATVVRYWHRMISLGRGVPPPRKATEEAVLDYVTRHPGGIGYVSRDVPLPRGLREVEILP
jgi:hypothetical protein